jgi:hypothetical protein
MGGPHGDGTGNGNGAAAGRHTPPPLANVQDTWFGDVPLRAWQSSGAVGEMVEPWVSFARAAELVESGKTPEAVQSLAGITRLPDLESRHYLQAWHALAELGSPAPADVADRLNGVVVEAHLDDGPEVLAAYVDHRARYLNYSGKVIVWEARVTSIDERIDALLAAGEQIVRETGAWKSARPGTPPRGHVRINALTAGGIHFGQATFAALARNPVGAPVLQAATELIQALVQHTSAEAG